MTVRLLNWNIGHGGGSRIPDICSHIESVEPDLLVLTEFQTRNESSLRLRLEKLGYPFVTTSNPVANRNGLLVASKWRLDHADDEYAPDTDRERWLAVRLAALNLEVLAVHIPGAPDNKFEDGYGISGAKRKELFWERVIGYAIENRDRRAVIVGDFNTGLRIDAEGAMFKKSHYMTNLIETGFVDTFRHLHPQDREYTWYSKRKDRMTGKSEDLNGFRLDYIFVSSPLRSAIADAVISQEPREAGASDHASVIADIEIYPKDRLRPVYDFVSEAEAPAHQYGGDRVSEFVAPGQSPNHSMNARAGNGLVRFDLAPEVLPDMTCGVNGQGFVQQFRPTYFTAEWSGAVLKEVRIWGPRVLQDGSLGKRALDHRWKVNAATGGINVDDLPTVVAAQLRSYAAGVNNV